jgi:hypothetical protein
MTNKKGERSISRANLEAHGIHYDPNETCIFPENISAVRNMLLSFEHIVPDCGWRNTLCKQESAQNLEEIDKSGRQPPESAWILSEDYGVRRNARWYAALESMNSCHTVAKEAQELHRDSEDRWMLFWRMNTFMQVSGSAHEQPGFQ